MLRLQLDLSPVATAAYAWLRVNGHTDDVVDRAVLVLAGIESGDGHRCTEAVEEYGAIAPEILDELADGAATLAAAFRQEAYVVRMARGEIK